MNALKCRTLGATRAQTFENVPAIERRVRKCAIETQVGSVHCWKGYSLDRSSTHACTPSCSNRWYIEQENLIAGKPE